MNRVSISTMQPEKANNPVAPPTTLPCWESLPAERQHELVTTLAMIVVKRLLELRQTQREIAHD